MLHMIAQDVPMVDAAPFWPIALIPLLPLIGAFINGVAGHALMKRFGPAANHTIAILLPTGSFIIAVVALAQLLGHDAPPALAHNAFPFLHVGLLDADMAFWFDPLSATMTLIITAIGTLIHVYSAGYMRGDDAYWRFFAYLNLFMASMLVLVLGDNFLVMFIGWEGVGLCSYLLIAFWYKEKANAVAGMKAFIVNRVGDFGFVLGVALLFWGLMGNYGGAFFDDDGYAASRYGFSRLQLTDVPVKWDAPLTPTLEGALLESQSRGVYRQPKKAPATSLRFEAVRARVEADKAAWDARSPGTKKMMGMALVTLICLFLFVGATGKSAQIPLYVWLPDAMAGPTPVSALIHAATMVTAGVYMVARLNFLFALSPAAMTVVALVGAATALYAATIGLFQYDIKKVLAYSTVSQLGYMFIGVGVGAYWAGVYHLLTHAVFKALLFLGSGSVILGCHHEQDMRKMGGLQKFMPVTRWTYWAGCVAITTAPVFLLSNGFFSKDEILWKAFDAQHLLVPGWVIWLIGFVGAGLTSFYMWRSYYMTFTGEYRGQTEKDEHGHGGTPHESPLSMTSVLVTLAVLILPTAYALGFWPLFHVTPLFEHWLHPVVGAATESLSWRSGSQDVWWLELTFAFLSVALTMAMWAVARALYKDAKSKIPENLLASDSPLLRTAHRLVFNKYYVDEIYDFLIVRRARQLSVLLYALDQRVIDGLVNLAGFIGRIVAAIDGMIDALIVDGAVNGVAYSIGAAGRAIQRTQTGRIQTYLAGVTLGVLLLILIGRLLLA